MNQARLYLDTLNAEEQDKLLFNLTKYAKRKAQEKFWRTGNGEELSDGENAFSVVSLAFEKVLEGKRTWNSETEPDFTKYMLDTIDSLLFHLATGKDNKIFVNENDRRFAASGERKNAGALAVAEENFIAANDRKQFENSEWLVRNQLSPEDQLIAAEEKTQKAQVIKAIREAIADDNEVSAMVEAMENNIVKSRDIAGHTGIDVDRIYNARKRLNTIAAKVRQKFNI